MARGAGELAPGGQTLLTQADAGSDSSQPHSDTAYSRDASTRSRAYLYPISGIRSETGLGGGVRRYRSPSILDDANTLRNDVKQLALRLDI